MEPLQSFYIAVFLVNAVGSYLKNDFICGEGVRKLCVENVIEAWREMFVDSGQEYQFYCYILPFHI